MTTILSEKLFEYTMEFGFKLGYHSAMITEPKTYNNFIAYLMFSLSCAWSTLLYIKQYYGYSIITIGIAVILLFTIVQITTFNQKIENHRGICIGTEATFFANKIGNKLIRIGIERSCAKSLEEYIKTIVYLEFLQRYGEINCLNHNYLYLLDLCKKNKIKQRKIINGIHSNAIEVAYNVVIHYINECSWKILECLNKESSDNRDKQNTFKEALVKTTSEINQFKTDFFNINISRDDNDTDEKEMILKNHIDSLLDDFASLASDIDILYINDAVGNKFFGVVKTFGDAYNTECNIE